MSFLRVLWPAGAVLGALFLACGKSDGGSGFPGDADAGMTGETGGDHSLDGLTALAIDPLDAVIEATPSAAAQQTYKVIGKFAGKPDREITDKITFGLPSSGPGATLGSFGGNLFHSAIGRGGVTTVIVGANGLTAQTSLTVHFTAIIAGPDLGTPLPSNPETKFTGTADAARAPSLVYPNDKVMLPPNLHRLEVHYRPGAAANTLFEIAFSSPAADIRTYLRCPTPTNGGCIHQLDPVAYQYVAESNRGGVPAKLRVRASSDTGGGFGESAAIDVSFAENDVEGGIYYWTVTTTSIMRFDFGGKALVPEVFLQPSDVAGACIGCHALSRDGTKLVASLSGEGNGQIVYVKDVATPKPLTLAGDAANHIQFASFNPTGDRFVSVYGDSADLTERYKLWVHDGTTGVRIPGESIPLTYEPDHPDWSLDGTKIAFDHVGTHGMYSQTPQHCGIDLITKTGATWGTPTTLVPMGAGLSRYNPTFAPDSSFLLFSESTCPGGDTTSGACNADSNTSAKTWATLLSGTPPVRLSQAGRPGVEDGAATDLSDTFPRFSPFQETQGTGKLFWATLSSRRNAGLRVPGKTGGRSTNDQWLWMFAVDPAKVALGQDGSYSAFLLPFQELTTSNHIGQWTSKVVPVTPPK